MKLIQPLFGDRYFVKDGADNVNTSQIKSQKSE
jgi:hypothetical protein